MSADVLATRLSVEPPEKILAFAEKLAELRYAIDSAERAEQHLTDPTAGDDSLTIRTICSFPPRCRRFGGIRNV